MAKDLEKAQGVIQPLRVRPVGQVDLFFYALPMKVSMGKPIDGKKIGIFFFQPDLEIFKFLWLSQLTSGIRSQPQANRIGGMGTGCFAYIHHLILQRGKGFRPIIPAVYIGTISKMMSLS